MGMFDALDQTAGERVAGSGVPGIALCNCADLNDTLNTVVEDMLLRLLQDSDSFTPYGTRRIRATRIRCRGELLRPSSPAGGAESSPRPNRLIPTAKSWMLR